MHGELKQIRMSEDDEIRRVMSPAQLTKFEEYLKLRKEMVGSSRGAKDFLRKGWRGDRRSWIAASL